MLFNSLHFLIFFAVVLVSYFLIAHRFRWVFLLLASYYFYMCWKPAYIILIVSSTLIDYYAGIKMGEEPVKVKRRKYLLLSLCANLGMLFTFKYFNFFSHSIGQLFQRYDIFMDVPMLDVLLPVGISFYTFQTLSYSIDVYQGRQKPERHLGVFALYVAFFPQLVAGPIERSSRLLPQFRHRITFDAQRIKSGFLLMLWGFFKKLVIADRAAVLVNQVYNNPSDYSGIPFLIATYYFAFQIYCDFSGYSDIAIGAARVMGIDLMKNFNQPYLSRSIAEFWQRWHISLSTWFKDYLYIPLGGNRVVKWRWYYNLMIVFLVSGLWHGANWTFVVWGALHGLYMVGSLITKGLREKISQKSGLNNFPRIQSFCQILCTFHLVLFAWIFFRANSIQDAFYIIQNIFKINFQSGGYGMGLNVADMAIMGCAVLLMEAVEYGRRKPELSNWIWQKPLWSRWLVYYGMIFGTLILGHFDSGLEFVYFQF